MRRYVLSVVVLLGLVVVPLAAQTTVVANPTKVEFTASADHAATFPDATPIVVSYKLRYFAEGATQPITEVDLGKPTPVANLITVDLVAGNLLVGVPVAQKCVAKVAAVNSYGEGLSPQSTNSFFRAGAPRASGAPLFSR